jgi:ABC-type glycerol-3-phosphate transport system substrate-binding protein
LSADSNPTSRRRFLRVAALLPATILVGAATGCGVPREADSVAAATPAPRSNPPSAPAASAPATPTLPPAVELVVRWNGLDPQGQAAARDFAAGVLTTERIAITPDFSDWASSFEKITTGLAAGTVPDIWQAGGLWTPVLAARGATLFLDQFVNGWPDWDDFYPFAIDDVTYEEHVHGVPYRTNFRSPVIRPSAFAAAGLDPKVPTTWDELNAVAPQLTISDGDRFDQAGFNQSSGSSDWDLWLLEAGAPFVSRDDAITSDHPGVRAALDQYNHFLDDGIMPADGMESGIPNLHAFCAGKVAIQRLWPGDVANCEVNAPDVFEDVLVGEPWVGPSGQKNVEMYVDKYMGYKLTKSPASVYTVLEHLSDLDTNLAINAESRRSMPCRTAAEAYAMYAVSPWREFFNNIQYAAPSRAFN